MNEQVLRQLSELTVMSLLQDPEVAHPIDPLLRLEQRLKRPLIKGEPIAFSKLFMLIEDLYPYKTKKKLELLEFSDALWLKGSGALFDGTNGLILPGTMSTRFPRHRQIPYASKYWLELTRPLNSLPRIEQALLLPHASCRPMWFWFSEIMASLWPLLPTESWDIVGYPALLPFCKSEDPFANQLIGFLRDHQISPMLDEHLPPAIHFQRILVPEPSMRLHAQILEIFLDTTRYFGSWLTKELPKPNIQPFARVFIDRLTSINNSDQLAWEHEVLTKLVSLGWRVIDPKQSSLAEQINLLGNFYSITSFDASALQILSCIDTSFKPLVLLAGEKPDLDLLLQLRTQDLQGWFLPFSKQSLPQANEIAKKITILSDEGP